MIWPSSRASARVLASASAASCLRTFLAAKASCSSKVISSNKAACSSCDRSSIKPKSDSASIFTSASVFLSRILSKNALSSGDRLKAISVSVSKVIELSAPTLRFQPAYFSTFLSSASVKRLSVFTNLASSFWSM